MTEPRTEPLTYAAHDSKSGYALDILTGRCEVRGAQCYQCSKPASRLVLAHPDTTFGLHPVYVALCDDHAAKNAGTVVVEERSRVE